MKRRKLTLLSVLIIVASVTMVVRVSDMVNAILHYNTDVTAAPKGVAFAESSNAPSGNNDMHAEAPAQHGESDDKAKQPMQDTDEDISRWTDADDTDLELPQLRVDMFKELITRRENLDKRQRILHQREALLRAAEQELERKYDELTQLRSEIGALLEQQSEEEQARIKSLVKTYEGMKAKDAARIFNTLSIDVLIEVMSAMSERKMAPVIAAMETERARQVTILLSEQKKLPSLPVQ
jgi:flagellar motility protein MotE (MotC chaperone)